MLRRLVLVAALVSFAPDARAQSIAAAYGGTIPPQCRGAHVDLTQLSQCRCTIQPPPIVTKGQAVISARSTCGDAIEKLAIASSIAIAVTAAPSVIHGGDPMTLAISITNRSSTDVPVVFERTAPWLVNDLSMRDAIGNEVSREGPCRSGFSASGSNYMVVLPPGGVAEWRLPWNAATRVSDRGCNMTSRPLLPGAYTLAVSLMLVQLPNVVARGTMLVQ